LGEILKDLPQIKDERLLIGVNQADDAGVFQVAEDMALIQTVDFFTPIVDDPYQYGLISAANALSDIYAMGAKPLTALNIVAYSPGIFSAEVLSQILRGGHDKVLEAGAVIVGGHTATDDELKYGLSVTGACHPDKVITNAGAKPGDLLVLTKPIGTGIITTALKAGKNVGIVYNDICKEMATLNKSASEAMQFVGVNACTDISGFGLLGHAYEMAHSSNVRFKINTSYLPLFKDVFKWLEAGYVPGGTYANAAFLKDKVFYSNDVIEKIKLILCDAQTSGGLLISVSSERCDQLLTELKERNVHTCVVIGEVIPGARGIIEVIT
jgi:selenide,water dikinase